MGKDRIIYLLKQYANDKASREEVEEMFEWMRLAGSEEVLRSMIAEEWLEEGNTVSGEGDWEKIWAVVRACTVAGTVEGRRSRLFSIVRAGVAAALVLMLGGGAVYWIAGKKRAAMQMAGPVANSRYKDDIAPGGNKALLTLANGSTIVLDSAHDGTLAQQGTTKIIKLDGGALAYRAAADSKGQTTEQAIGQTGYNTIATPRGGQYRIILPDGSKVWLNAASSLRFPAAFTGSERTVELTGEAYFEIAKNAEKPFHVRVPSGGTGGGDMDVEVLGTSFNVMAYSNEEKIHTTLLEGKVKVKQGALAENLSPGRQAIIDQTTHAMEVADGNIDQAVAWKDGLFRFRETDIRELMRQVERWYDVDVVYRTDRGDQDFTGVVSRNKNVSTLLQMLELTGTVHFKIEGKRIIVLP
jgi:ferric-dicitrate binding protein FerR (iron transport regulator)